MIHGTNYVSGCPTRSGEYAFCGEMRVPSYSIAKSAFAGVALMRLGQIYGPKVYGLKIKDYIPAAVIRGKWDQTTFGNTSDMATGNFNLGDYEADEDSPVNDTFLIAEAYAPKLADAFGFQGSFGDAGDEVGLSECGYIYFDAGYGCLLPRARRARGYFFFGPR